MTFPTTPILDNFNRANEGPPPSASWITPYTAYFSGFSVSGNQCVSAAAPAAACWNTQYGPDSEVYVTLANLGADAFLNLYIRLDDTDFGASVDYYNLYITHTSGSSYDWYLQVTLDAVPTTLDSGTATINDGDSIGMSAIGTTIKAWHKPSAGSWTELSSKTDSSVSTAGYIMIDWQGVGTLTIDDFGGGTVSSGCVGSGPAYIVNCRALSATGTGAVGLRVSDTAYALNTRTDATTGVVVDNTSTLYAYGLQYGSATLTGTGALVPLAGDRSAYDALNYQAVHANDINDAAGIHHTTANMGSFFISNALDAGSIFVGNASNIATPYILSGDATLDPSGVLTLNTVNPDVGIFGDSTFVPRITVNAKGLITAVSDVAIVAATGGHTIQDEGTPLTARSNLNFVGAGVTATDDAGNNATVVTIPSASGVTRSGATTDAHLAVWNGSSADSIKDGGAVPSTGVARSGATTDNHLAVWNGSSADSIKDGGTVPAGTVTSVGTGTGLTGGPITGSGTVTLADTAVTPGSYTNTNVTVDQQGRITAASNGSAGSGTVTSVATGTGLTGGPITTTGTVSLADTAVTPGAYTSADITVDQQGRITAAANGTGPLRVYNEIQTGTGGTVYHLANIAAVSTVRVYINGIRQPVEDGVTPTDEVTFITAPAVGDTLIFDYEVEAI